MKYISVLNNQAIALQDIPVHNYELFAEINLELMNGNPARHCVSYFGYSNGDKIKLICCIADDELHLIYISSTLVDRSIELNSSTFALVITGRPLNIPGTFAVVTSGIYCFP